MGKQLTFILVCWLSLFVGAQTIELHSITTERQLVGDKGYTLDGDQMIESRLKLLNPSNFGASGIYPKKINISDDFGISGSLTNVTRLPPNDLFFFGAFDRTDPSTEAFTDAEIDSLYKWSLRGGKLIITAGLGNSNVLSKKWGYRSTFTVWDRGYYDISPDTINHYETLWTGPFGYAWPIYEGGGIQGYFYKTPENSVTLGISTTYDNKVTVFMDCTTLDLFVVDVDVYTSYYGRISGGNKIQNAQDRYLANTMVFMDKLQSPPVITKNGDQYQVDPVYLEYKWYHNGELVAGANGNSLVSSDEGSFQVEVKVNGGCKTKSDVFFLDPDCEVFVPTAFSPDNNNVNDKACVYASCLENVDFKIFDRWGELIFETQDPLKCWDGIYKGAKANTGAYAWKLSAKRKSGGIIDKKGNITLIR